MTEFYKVIEWRHRGCRCILLRADISRNGWRVTFPDYAGSQPTPSHWRPEVTAHKWTRFRRHGDRDRVWRLSLDATTWPPPGPPEYGVVRDVDVTKPATVEAQTMCVQVACAHHSMREIEPRGSLTDLFLKDAEQVRKTRQPVFRELPLSSA